MGRSEIDLNEMGWSVGPSRMEFTALVLKD